jgi:two-component sensor histidine kinase
MLREMRHRIANSLQIIASILLLKAGAVTSEETKNELRAAHQRVMSVAAVQRQLAATTIGDVGLRDYFAELCESIGASMIRDHDQLKLEVSSDDTVATADVSVSLGLIVTELVINALKHAFPGRREGKINVDYRAEGAAWTLSVGDNGVGMLQDEASAKSGLGTSIVAALAQQLQADVHVSDNHPGHKVSIVHEAGAGPPS